eukprot:CAMPEP_0194061292 /NCGR_PEP_ID=MMETSP0009_2-20130614/74197_1 /TAXON_ID=210454 /ORGANISM="Grammatophora oceanica, Strain CCMP 410" /LENGTH=528 /DNA_ID=CAMNT_0038712551 /DNA_START=221 /DNA_END=1807 /DNA_ORIENTATION=-
MDNDSPDEKDGKRPLTTRIIVACRKFFANFLRSLFATKKRFMALSWKLKLFALIQFMGISLGMGSIAYSRFSSLSSSGTSTTPIEAPYSSFLHMVKETNNPKSDWQVVDVKVTKDDDTIVFKALKAETKADKAAIRDYRQMKGPVPTDLSGMKAGLFYTRQVHAPPQFVDLLSENSIPFSAGRPGKSVSTVALSLRAFSTTLYLLFMWRLYRNMTNNGSSSSVGKLAKTGDLPAATFDDIEGMDGAKFEVMEFVDTLRNPTKYAILGARAPKGLLLEGPPGTGKTLLARATAATAGVPLLYCSGSDFTEVYVGRGAARVRKTFENAAKLAPCIVFIDELDALGKSRDSLNGFRSNDEADQTLNQLLACMDGINSSKQICVMGATNRRQVLDQALVRPGRFDRIVTVSLPDTKGREAILRVHAQKLPGFEEGTGVDPRRPNSLGVGKRVDLSAIAAATPGLAGAELEFIVNEAAIRAVRRVSSALRGGTDPKSIVPNVEAEDFEGSVAGFFSSRRTSGGLNNVFNQMLK